MRRRWLLVIICGWTAIFLNTLLNAEDGVFPRRDLTRVDYQALQQENIAIFPTLSALAGESYSAVYIIPAHPLFYVVPRARPAAKRFVLHWVCGGWNRRP
jgi:hypothetical protein